MSLIPCTSLCVYQLDGTCTLQRAMSSGTLNSHLSNCVHFVEAAGLDLSRQQRVSNGFDRGEL